MSDLAFIATASALAGCVVAFGLVGLCAWAEHAMLIRRQKLNNRQRQVVIKVLRAIAEEQVEGREYRHRDEFADAVAALGLEMNFDFDIRDPKA